MVEQGCVLTNETLNHEVFMGKKLLKIFYIMESY